MKQRLVIMGLMGVLLLIPSAVSADCELHLTLAGCVQDAVTRKPVVGARVFYNSVEVYTDSKGCFLLTDESIVAENDFFPTHYCIVVYKRGYELATSCEQRRSLMEPFPPCLGSSILSLSFHYGIIEMHELTTDVSDPDVTLPGELELYQNYPNPFNPDTEIGFSLAEAADVRLEVFDVLGRRVALLHDGNLPAGSHQMKWMAGDAAAGVYFYRLRAGGEMQTKRMLLLK